MLAPAQCMHKQYMCHLQEPVSALITPLRVWRTAGHHRARQCILKVGALSCVMVNIWSSAFTLHMLLVLGLAMCFSLL